MNTIEYNNNTIIFKRDNAIWELIIFYSMHQKYFEHYLVFNFNSNFSYN